MIVLITPIFHINPFRRGSSRTFWNSSLSTYPVFGFSLFCTAFGPPLTCMKNKFILVQKHWVAFPTFDKLGYLPLTEIWKTDQRINLLDSLFSKSTLFLHFIIFRISMNIFQMSCQMIIPFELFIAKMTLKNIDVLFFPFFIKWPIDVIVLVSPTCHI